MTDAEWEARLNQLLAAANRKDAALLEAAVAARHALIDLVKARRSLAGLVTGSSSSSPILYHEIAGAIDRSIARLEELQRVGIGPAVGDAA